MAKQDSARMGKKRENARNEDAEKGIPQHIPKNMANQELSKESELKEGKNEKNGNGTYRVIGTRRALFAKK